MAKKKTKIKKTGVFAHRGISYVNSVLFNFKAKISSLKREDIVILNATMAACCHQLESMLTPVFAAAIKTTTIAILP